MTEHAWVQEQIAAFLADGLDAAERERFQTHVRDCVECTTAIEAARAFDAGLANLFASVRPGPMLEDRTVRALRTPKTIAEPRRGVWRRRIVTGLAASLLFGGLAAGASFLIANGGLPMPGEGFAKYSRHNRESVAESSMHFLGGEDDDSMTATVGVWRERDLSRAQTILHDNLEARKKVDLTNVDKGLDSELASSLPLGRTDLALDGLVVKPTEGKSSGNAHLYSRYVQPHFAAPSGGINVNGNVPENVRWDDSLSFSVDAGGKSNAPVALGLPAIVSGTTHGNPNTWHFVPQNFFGSSAIEDQTRRTSNTGNVPTSGPTTAAGVTNGTTPYYANPTYAGRGDTPVEFARSSAGTVTAGKGFNFDTGVTAKPTPVVAQVDDPQQARRIIIRSGDIEFEVNSFDPAVATVTQLVTKIKGGYVGTVNSEKLANGKVKGSIVVRVPPEALDGLVLDLRKEIGKAGELKGQKIGSSDVTKQYTDTESRLKAARAMELRLLEIIKTGKGEIKQLLEAEKELGVWRTKIEEYEGELRYYANLAALSTLTITLAEKDIRVAAGITENERVQAGIEVEDVDKAFRDAIDAVTEAKGRVTKSELKQLSAGQFNALLFFEVSPDAAGPLRDRLKQLGRVARLEIDRVQTADGGPPVKDAKVTRGNTTFQVQFYNLANVAPRETAVVQVATADVVTTFRTLRDAVEKAKGRVVTAQVGEGERQNVSAQFDFEVKRTEEATITAALAAAGDVVSKTISRAPESDSVTDTKVAFRTTLFNAARLKPRETATLAVEVPDVEATAAVLTAQVNDAKGRVIDSQVSHDRSGKLTAKLVYDVPLPAAVGLVEKAKAAGAVRVQQSNRDPAATEGKFATARIDITLSNADLIVPSNDGVWPQVRKGLTYSASALLSSLTWVIFGLCVVLPWVVLIYLIARVLRRFTRSTTPDPVPLTVAAPPTA
ncbi:DUF4349 domain-containing protein [Limnoglobus roseus]|uniref:Uncharacterized protein n=1 Tax=Limnoglobus roseus TaxID=2598579 RepID=A0A5C1AM90_9BACT|nr:DUF4349 domain-containing protein [Limnoglobus roseus]QEL19695.1 hypothetical protein PX52LOC_06774 [Limnoglobus roseus]